MSAILMPLLRNAGPRLNCNRMMGTLISSLVSCSWGDKNGVPLLPLWKKPFGWNRI